jgi:hypothetical protein
MDMQEEEEEEEWQKVEEKWEEANESKILKHESIRKAHFILVFPPLVSQLLYFYTIFK